MYCYIGQLEPLSIFFIVFGESRTSSYSGTEKHGYIKIATLPHQWFIQFPHIIALNVWQE